MARSTLRSQPKMQKPQTRKPLWQLNPQIIDLIRLRESLNAGSQFPPSWNRCARAGEIRLFRSVMPAENFVRKSWRLRLILAQFSENRQNLEKSTETLTDGATHPWGTILRTNSLTLSRSDTPWGLRKSKISILYENQKFSVMVPESASHPSGRRWGSKPYAQCLK